MGDIAEMMIEGVLCESCGGYIDEDGDAGFPRKCHDCEGLKKWHDKEERFEIAMKKIISSGFNPTVCSGKNFHIKVGDWNFWTWTGKIYNPKIKIDRRGLQNFIDILKSKKFINP